MQDWVFRLGLESLKFFLVKSVRFVNHCAAFETRKPNQSCLQLFFSYFQVARWSGTFGRFDQRFRRKDGKQKATGSRDRSLWSQNPYKVAFIYFWKKLVDFWHRKLTLKVRFCHLLTNHNASTNLKKKLLWVSWFLAKKRHTQRKNFQTNWLMNYGLSKSAKMVLSKSIFYVKNQQIFFKKKIHLRIAI